MNNRHSTFHSNISLFTLSFLQFVASEHKINNGVNNGEHKDVAIEPDGPSVVSKEDDDSKVNNLSCRLSR